MILDKDTAIFLGVRQDRFKNLLELKEYTMDIPTLAEDEKIVFFIRFAYSTFINNLKDDYASIVADNDCCGYWAVLLGEFFGDFGFDCKFMEIGSKDRQFFHCWARLVYKDCAIELARNCIFMFNINKGSDYEDAWKAFHIKTFKNVGTTTEHKLSLELIDKLKEVSLLEFSKKTIEELRVYADELISGDVDRYKPSELKEHYKGYSLMYAHLTDYKQVRNIKEITSEQEYRRKRGLLLY